MYIMQYCIGKVPLPNVKFIIIWEVKPFGMVDAIILEECAASIFRCKWMELSSCRSGVQEGATPHVYAHFDTKDEGSVFH
jgi:hypothetical protein